MTETPRKLRHRHLGFCLDNSTSATLSVTNMHASCTNFMLLFFYIPGDPVRYLIPLLMANVTKLFPSKSFAVIACVANVITGKPRTNSTKHFLRPAPSFEEVIPAGDQGGLNTTDRL